MLGELIGSHPAVAYFGEFFAFYFSRVVARRTLGRVPSRARDAYLDSLEAHAREFAEREMMLAGREVFCESTPLNSLICEYLANEFPHATFVVTVRHYTGVIQSLRRSFQDGYHMTIDDDVARARLWADCYTAILRLPTERCIYVDYDALCRTPESEVARFLSDLEARTGLARNAFQLSTLTISHATTEERLRETIAVSDENGTLRFRKRRTVDRTSWGAEDEERVRKVVRHVADDLKSRLRSIRSNREIR